MRDPISYTIYKFAPAIYTRLDEFALYGLGMAFARGVLVKVEQFRFRLLSIRTVVYINSLAAKRRIRCVYI